MAYYTDDIGNTVFIIGGVEAGINFDIYGRKYYFVSTPEGAYDVRRGRFLPGVDVSGVSYLLDTYPAFAAYSTRQLSSTATNCLRVRRASDNAEADIGFADGWLDESAVATHCGASTGFVVTWYDQSGNGYDVTQATAGNQPQIYDGSVVLKDNGAPCMDFVQATGHNLCTTSAAISEAQPNTVFSVQRAELANSYVYNGVGAAIYQTLYWRAGDQRLFAGTNLTITPSTLGEQILASALFNSTSSVLRENGTETGTGDAGSNALNGDICIGSFAAASSYFDGKIQEVIFYNSDQTANFSAIETDLCDAFLSRHVVTANGDAAVDGSNACDFDGTGDYLSVPDSADWDLDSNASAFTISMFVNFTSFASSPHIYNQVADGNNYIEMQVLDNASIKWTSYSGGVLQWSEDFTFSTMSTGTWYHIALTWDGSNFRMFLDGTQQDTDRAYSSTIPDIAAPLNIGRNQFGAGSAYLTGSTARYHVVGGTALWTTNFTAPDRTSEITLDAKTVLALNFDGAASSTFIKDSAKPDAFRS